MSEAKATSGHISTDAIVVYQKMYKEGTQRKYMYMISVHLYVCIYQTVNNYKNIITKYYTNRKFSFP